MLAVHDGHDGLGCIMWDGMGRAPCDACAAQLSRRGDDGRACLAPKRAPRERATSKEDGRSVSGSMRIKMVCSRDDELGFRAAFEAWKAHLRSWFGLGPPAKGVVYGSHLSSF